MTKKTKTESHLVKSKVFEHFRTLGLISDAVPFALISRGAASFVTTSIGRAFHIYDTESLGVQFVSDEYESNIIAIAANEDDTYVATETGFIRRVQRAKVIEKISFAHQSIIRMEVLGDVLLVLADKCLSVFTLDLKKLIGKINFECDENTVATCMVHPNTYLNKVIIGFSDGRLQLWNFISGKMIYAFACPSFPLISLSCLAQSTVVDVIAAGYGDGSVVLFDAKQDVCLFKIQVKSSVTSISFRSGEKAQMIVGCTDGLLSVWDLENRSMILLLDAHEKAISRAEFLPGGLPIIITNSDDNSLKEWTLSNHEQQEEIRLLRSRSGHSASPKIVRFWDETSILSGGLDGSLRLSSLIKDSQSHELSQGSLESKAKKLQVRISELRQPPITDLAMFKTKETGWANLVTSHEASSTAKTWRCENKCIGEHSLGPIGALITAVATSPCGNFGLAGGQDGMVHLFNLQSGQKRKSFQISSPVQGIAVDQFSREVLIVGKDGSIQIFDYNRPSKSLYQEKSDKSQVFCFDFKPESGLASIGCSNGIIKILDLEARRIVRIMNNNDSPTDLCFSGDGKWLLVCSKEGKCISTWDLPSGLLIDKFTCHKEPSSISISPNGEFIVTCHEGDKALHVWSNKAILQPVTSSNGKGTTAAIIDDVPFGLELAIGARSKPSAIVHLDTIKAKSKPEAPLEAPKKAPFFLDSLLQQPDASALTKRDAEGDEAAITKESDDDLKLDKFLSENQAIAAIKHLLNSGASKIHLEILNLKPEHLKGLLLAVLEEIKAKRNWDMMQAILNVTMGLHKETLILPEYNEILADLEASHRQSWTDLEALLNEAICLTAFSRDRY